MGNNRRERAFFRTVYPLRDRSQRGFYRHVRELPLLRRLDPIIIAVATLILFSITVTWLAYQFIGIRLGWFDQAPLREIADDRRLVNVRADLGQNPLLDAVYHPADEQVYIAQQGGIIHRYDPLTGIWQSDDLITAGAPVDGDFIQLSSGCGSYLEINLACADNDSVWAWTRDGGLVQYSGGQWTTVFTTSRFIGSVTGKTVDQSELVTAAVSASPENRWLVIGTRANGIGVYDSFNRVWIDPSRFRGALASPEIMQLVWWRDRFWVGSSAGLSSIRVSENGVDIDSYADANGARVDGAILDLDAAPEGEADAGLWVLEQAACANPPANCLRLSRFDVPESAPTVLIDEHERHQDIDLSRFDFAQAVGDDLVFSGEAGVYAYNNRMHSWHQLSTERVTAVLPTTDNTGFYFGYRGGVRLVQYAALVGDTWTLPDGEVKKLMFGGQNDILALTLSERAQNLLLHTLEVGSREVEPVYALDETTINPALFRSALTSGDWVAFITEAEGALLHNIRTREYQEVDSRMLPLWLTQAAQIINLPSGAFILHTNDRQQVEIYFINAAHLSDVSYYRSGDLGRQPPITGNAAIAAPLVQAWTWDANSIGLIDANGSVYHIDAQTVDPQVGEPEQRLTRTAPSDLVPLDNTLLYAVGGEILSYDLSERAWATFATPRLGSGELLDELVNAGGSILARTNRDRLIAPNGTVVIGGSEHFAMNDASLSDAWLVDQHLFLAGDGAVNRYDFDARDISETWSIGTGDVALMRIINDTPLTLVGTDAYFGDSQLNGANRDSVLSATFDGERIWTTHENASNRYLVGQTVNGANLGSSTICFFRQPDAGAARISDARSLDDGSLAVATDAGLRFYSPSARTWYSAPSTVMEPDRVYSVGGRLLLVDEGANDQRLAFIDQMQLPDSCSTNNADVHVEASYTVIAHSVDEVNGRVALLMADGTVSEWRDGRLTTVLEPASSAPVSAELRRVFERPGYLLFSTDTELWRYDLTLRTWREINLGLGSALPANIDVEYAGGTNLISVRTANGAIYTGTFADGATQVSLSRVYAPTQSVSGAFSAPLVDVQRRGEQWAFVLEDHIRYFDPDNRTWTDSASFAPDTAQQFVQIGRFSVVIGAQNWHIANTITETPNTFTAYTPDLTDQAVYLDSSANLWRFTAAGEVLRCRQNAAYACETVRAPFVITPTDVSQAVSWGDLTLFMTMAGIRVYDEGAHAERSVSALNTITGISAIYRTDQWLYLHALGSITVLDTAGSVTTLPDVQDVVFAEDNTVYVQRAGAWFMLNGDTPTPVDPSIEPFTPEEVTPQPFPLDDDWATIQTAIVTLNDGRSAYRPVMSLSLAENALVGTYSTGETDIFAQEAYSAAQPSVPAPLDAGWLRWERDQRQFSVATSNGRVLFAPANFLSGDQLLFETISDLLPIDAATLLAANTFGLWEHHQADLSLDDPDIVYYPLSLNTPITAMHGRFLLGSEEVTTTGRSAITPLEFSISAVTFREDVATAAVSVTVQVDGAGAQDALVTAGFLWDENRRGLAYGDGDLLLQSDAGVQPITASLSQFDAQPNGLGNGAGVLTSASTGGVYLRDPRGATWFQRINGAWQTALDPTENRTLVNDAIWNWQISGGALEITLKGTAQAFTLTRVGFTSDQLRAGVALDGQLIVITDAFLELATNGDGLRNYAAARFPTVATDRIESYNSAVSGVTLYNRSGGALTGQWNPTVAQFESVAGSPTQQRDLVSAPRIRFTLNVGQIVKEINLDALDNSSGAWSTFQFDEGRFPFDVVNGVEWYDNLLYVGTNVGLQVYPSASAAWQNATRIYDFRAAASGSPQTVTRLGIPESAPDVFMARGGSVCVERSSQSAGFTSCFDPARLDSRLRLSNNFWYWVEANDTLTGRYRLADGSILGTPVNHENGRLSHDHIFAASICQNRVYTLWGEGTISISSDFTLNAAISSYSIPETPKLLICVDVPLISSQRTVPAQLYLLTAQGNLWTNAGATWQSVSDEGMVSDIIDSVSNPALYTNNRVRYRAGNLGTLDAFEYQLPNQDWAVLEWVSNPVSNLWSQNLDRWQQAEIVQGDLWVATEAGLLQVQRTNRTSITIDAAALVVVEPPLPPLDCPITELRAEGTQVTARCNQDSANVYIGTLDGTESTGVFTAATDDPFESVRYVNTYWTIDMAGNANGQRGELSARLDGEATQLVGGRFEHDLIDSLEVFHGDLVEIASSASGWYQSPRNDLSVEALSRNRLVAALPDLESVRRGDADSGVVLCLRAVGGDYTRLMVNAQNELEIRDTAESCPMYLGDQAIWRYRSDAGQLAIFAPETVGSGSGRVMRDGRFTDDIADGLPVSHLEVLDSTPEVAIYAPTEAGIIVMDADHHPRRLYLPPDTASLVIQVMDDGTLTYWGGDGLYRLDDSTPVGERITPPDNVELLALQNGADDILRLRWSQADERGWSFINPTENIRQDNGFVLNVTDFWSYQQNTQRWAGVTPQALFTYTPQLATIDFAAQRVNYDMPADFRLIEAIRLADQILLIGGDNLYQVDINDVLQTLRVD